MDDLLRALAANLPGILTAIALAVIGYLAALGRVEATRQQTAADVEANRAAQEKINRETLEKLNKQYQDLLVLHTEVSSRAASALGALDIMRQSLATANENSRQNAIALGEVKGLYTAALHNIDLLTASVAAKDEKIAALLAENSGLKATVVNYETLSARTNASLDTVTAGVGKVNDQVELANRQISSVLNNQAVHAAGGTPTDQTRDAHAVNVAADAHAAGAGTPLVSAAPEAQQQQITGTITLDGAPVVIAIAPVIEPDPAAAAGVPKEGTS